jgi:hypothetical protein
MTEAIVSAEQCKTAGYQVCQTRNARCSQYRTWFAVDRTSGFVLIQMISSLVTEYAVNLCGEIMCDESIAGLVGLDCYKDGKSSAILLKVQRG